MTASVTMSTFVGYGISSGTSRTSFVRRQRRLYENPEVAAFDFYRRPVAAIRGGRNARMDREAMTALVDQASERSRPHYAAVAEGWLRYLGRRDPPVVDVGQGRWEAAGMRVRISPQLALCESNGTVSVLYLYLKAMPLTRHGANLALCLMEEAMDELRPGGKAVVLDVRRAKPYVLARRDRPRVGAWARSEAAAFMSLWGGAPSEPPTGNRRGSWAPRVS